MTSRNNEKTIYHKTCLFSTGFLFDAVGSLIRLDQIDELAVGADMGNAFSRGLKISYDEFERGWKRSLE